MSEHAEWRANETPSFAISMAKLKRAGWRTTSVVLARNDGASEMTINLLRRTAGASSIDFEPEQADEGISKCRIIW
jgi:hypothetical protein